MTTLAFKIDTLYIACSPELGVISYGGCRDEAINNLAERIRSQQPRADERAVQEQELPA